MKRNKTGGRKKGTPNKTTAEIKAVLTKFVGDNIEQLQAKFDRLEPAQQLQFIRDILRYVVPTISAQTIEADITPKQTIIEFVSASELTPEQLEAFTEQTTDFQ